MTNDQTTKGSTDRIANEMDLEPIIVKAMDKEEGYGWNLDFALSVSNEYRKYLILCVENPDFSAVPSNYVDDFWHLHILDTLKYEIDCHEFLGFFLHHFPYFGMRGEEDAKNLMKAWMATRDLYVARFGPIPEELWPISNRCPNCGRRCSNSPEKQYKRPGIADLAI